MMAAAQLTSTSSLSIKCLPSFERFPPVKGFSNVNVSSTRSSRGLVVKAAATLTTVKPIGNRVLIKTKVVEEKTASGLLIPAMVQTKPQTGQVVSLGSGRSNGYVRIPFSVKIGSEVIFTKYAGTEIQVNGSNHLLVSEDDIIGIVETDDVMDLKPLYNQILIKLVEVAEKTDGGLYLPEKAKERPSIGTVITTGPGPLDDDGNYVPMPVSPGSTVMFSKFAGTVMKGGDGSSYVVLRDSDIMAVLS